jgi:putative transposase
MKKRIYHPFLILAFKAGILPAQLLCIIPRSTRFEWQHKSLESLFGSDWCSQNQKQLAVVKQVFENKRLMQINIALLRLLAIKRFMQKHTSALKQGLHNVPQTVYQNIHKVAAVTGLAKALRLLQLPHTAYKKMKQAVRCVQSPLGLCRIKHPSQLAQAEVKIIKTFCEDETMRHWPRSSVYWQIIRSGKAFFSLSTFYKYVAALHLKCAKVPGRRKNHTVGIRATAPLQIIHADITELRLQNNVRVYIYAIIDNCSRGTLHLCAHLHKKAIHLKEGLQQVYRQYLQPAGHQNCVLMTDDGSENYGEVTQLLTETENPSIQHIVAQADVDFSNSMVEYAHKELKYQWLYHHTITSLEQLNQLLAQYWVQNDARPRSVLDGLTPQEVLAGQQPAKHNYARSIAQAMENRKNENRKLKCCSFSF